MRAIAYPCLCLCFALVQITRTTPRRRTTLHLSQMRFTDARTFITPACSVEPSAPDLGARVKPGPLSYLPHDPAARPIPRRQFHFDLVADHQSHEVALGAPCEVRGQSRLAVDLHPIQPARQLLDDHRLDPSHPGNSAR